MKLLDSILSNKINLIFVDYVMGLTGACNPDISKKKRNGLKAIIKKIYADRTFRRVVSVDILEEVCKIRQLREGSGNYSAIESRLSAFEDRFMNLELYAYTINEWQNLSLFFKCNCLYKLGYICREKSKELIYLKDEKTIRHVRALVEDRRYDEAQIIINRLTGNKSKSKKRTIELIRAYINAMRGERVDYICDSSYRQFIEGKKTLIIGPTVESHDLEKKVTFLKEADVVIRNNVMLSNISQNVRTNISYYNGQGFQRIKEDGLQMYLKEFDWLAFKHGGDITPEQGKIHEALDVDELMYTGTANVLPIMVADLMLHGAEKIYVCGNNLFLSRKTHSFDYLYQPNRKEMIRGLVVHDLISQHVFLKTMYDFGIIVADEELANVLKLPTIEYLRSMENLYF